MPVKKKEKKAPIKKPKSKPRAKPKPKVQEDAIMKAYKAGFLAGIPAFGAVPRTGGNYSITQGLPQQVFASSGSVPIGSNINDKLLSAYNALVWAKEPPSKEEFKTMPMDERRAYEEALGQILGQEALAQFKQNMEQRQSEINPLFQAPSQRGGFDLQTEQKIGKVISEVLSDVVNIETSDDPTTDNPFSGSAFISRIRKGPQQLPRQTSGIFELNQIEKQDNALSNLARQSRADAEDIQVSQTLENLAYPEVQSGKKAIKPRKKRNE
jgi:hypothetical protein